jgi:hypothetical protein
LPRLTAKVYFPKATGERAIIRHSSLARVPAAGPG